MAPPHASHKAPAVPHPVVLLHGLGRSPRSMSRLADRLARDGHATARPGYPSRAMDPEGCAASLAPALAAFSEACGGGPIALVTHSMGGIVARHVSATTRLAAIVMLAPPNRGSEMADALSRLGPARAWFGPALRALRTDAAPAPVPSCPVGVIAGSRVRIPFTSRFVPAPHDGLVSASSTELRGAERLTLPVDHTFLMDDAAVGDAVAAFLAAGTFAPRSGAPGVQACGVARRVA